MSKYEVVGSALNAPAELPGGVKVGDEVDLDLDKDREKALIGAGVLVKKAEPKKTEKGQKS